MTNATDPDFWRNMSRRAFVAGTSVAALQPAAALPALGRTTEWQFGAHAVKWEPVEIVTGDTCLVSTSVNGTPAKAILDSGSGAGIIDKAFAARLRLAPGEARTITGLGGRTGAELVRDVEVTLAGDPHGLPFAVVSDLGRISGALGRPVEMIIGADMFTDRCIAIDFAAKRLAVAPSGTFKGGAAWRSVPLTRGAKQVLLTSASIAGGPPVPLMVDLGSSTALMLASSYVQERGLLSARSASTAAIGGVEGVREVSLFALDYFELGGTEVSAVPTLGMDAWQVASAIGNIGLPLLAQFDVVFDVTAGRLWLRPLSAGQRLPFLKDRSGFGLAREGARLRIVHVAADSPAARDGWRVGESIDEVNGVPVGDDYTRGDLWRWRFEPAGSSVRLRTTDGQRRVMALADYF